MRRLCLIHVSTTESIPNYSGLITFSGLLVHFGLAVAAGDVGGHDVVMFVFIIVYLVCIYVGEVGKSRGLLGEVSNGPGGG